MSLPLRGRWKIQETEAEAEVVSVESEVEVMIVEEVEVISMIFVSARAKYSDIF